MAGGVSEPLLSVAGLTADRSGRRILDDISFHANPNEILGIIGPNGAGKTTLFECVAGLQPVTRGTVSGVPRFYMPDAIRPWPDQTVAWTLRTMSCGPLQWLPELDLEHLGRQRVSSLSKGETKRMNVAMALLAPQQVLLLDEPFDGLDVRQTRSVMALLRGVGRTLILSIHQLADAAKICDRVLLLNAGRVVASGTPRELGDLEELFLAHT
ncbi:MAG TPA: ABC transporter ATP-binding protein [Thermoanaerobaculia bacterium]|nr:ABC transporter ATP-binding protein [Thermoanaerobaculia bacterium]